MLKGKKLMFVIVEMIIFCLALGCISSYAAEVKTITPKNTTTSNTSNTLNTVDEDEEEENTNKNTNSNTNTNKNKVNSISNRNSSNYSNTNKNASNSSELPYAGEGNSSIVFVGIALAASAVYAYKKISEYKNI